MKTQHILVRKIAQIDNHTFSIEWTDGLLGRYRLSDLQMHCPCANCTDEITGRRIIDTNSIDYSVKAVRISSVGRYALRIQFTSGCSSGIYGFDMLHRMAQNK